jgi:hypothetical protein
MTILSFARRAVGTVLLSLPVAAPIMAQDGPRVFEGTVTRPLGGGRVAPVSGDWAVLHRVGPDAAAPVDSMRLRANGTFAFRYRATGDATAVYFVSIKRGGVAYFTPPTREAVVRGGTADLTVFDTTSGPVKLTVRARHLIVTAPDSSNSSALRSVIEVYEISNDSTLTRVAGADGSPVFEVPVPDGVLSVAGGQGDVSPEAIKLEEGRVRVYAPIAPGLKQFSFSYELPVTQMSLAVHVETDVPVMEVLVEDPNGTVSGGELAAVDPVQVDGRPFKRFLGENTKPPTVIEVTMPGAQEGRRSIRLALVVTAVGAAMLLGLGMAFMRRGPQAFAKRRTTDPESLAVEIAALDEAYARIAQPTEEQKGEHYLKRAQLKGRLSAALAKRDGLA